MNRKEFESSMKHMINAIGVKMNKYQVELFWDEFKHNHSEDFTAACHFCGRGTPGKLPFQGVFSEAITAAMEMRLQKEKDDREAGLHKSHKVTLDPHERLLANRAAFEMVRQSRACRATGKNCWDKEKVRLAQFTSEKDEEIFKRYGRDGERMPTPAQIFGNIGSGVVDE